MTVLMAMYETMPVTNPYAMEYENGITAIVRKAGKASPKYSQLMPFTDIAIKQPTIISVQPVAHGGIDENMGAKKTEMKKHRPVVIAVRPVLPPSEIPAPDSMKVVTGERPKMEPIVIPAAEGELVPNR